MTLLQVVTDSPAHLSHKDILHLCVYSAEVLGGGLGFFWGGSEVYS